jgi:hypothetical protein
MGGGGHSFRRTRWGSWGLPALAWSLGPLAGVSIGLICDFGANVDMRFFEILAQIGPVVGLAVFVEVVIVFNQLVAEDGATAANKATVRTIIRTNAGLLVLAEGLALFSVAAQTTSTFLLVAVVVPLLLQLLLLVDGAYLRIGIHRIRNG